MIISRAPLRITLAGGGTDLPSFSDHFGGKVLSAAINKYVIEAKVGEGRCNKYMCCGPWA